MLKTQIFYNKGNSASSNILYMQRNSFVSHTIESLKELNPQFADFDIGLLELDDSQYMEDFARCIVYRVNPATEALEFIFPDSSGEEPEEPVYQAPLTDQVTELKAAVGELTMMIAASQQA